MNKQSKKECCNGCQNGKIGGNPSCKAKLIVEAISKINEENELKNEAL